MRVEVCPPGGGALLRSAAYRLTVWPALPLLQQEPGRRRPEAMREIKQLRRRAEMVAAGPVALAGGPDPLADPVVTAMRSVLRRAHQQYRVPGMTWTSSGASRLLVY
jgi:hypothetical protein